MSEQEIETPQDDDAATEREANETPDTQLDPEPEPTPEPEPEPEPAPPFEPQENPPPEHVTPEQIEKRAKQSRNAFDAFGRKLQTIHPGIWDDLIECPLCPDMHKGFFNLHDAGRIPEEIKTVVMQLLGIAREREYAQLPGFETCATCGGEGKGRTGSNVPDKQIATCPACRGTGYRAPQVEQGNGHVEHDPTLSGPLVHGLDVPQPDVDVWNEPRILPDGRENPNYGKMPNMKVPVEPWGVTAGLNALDAVQS